MDTQAPDEIINFFSCSKFRKWASVAGKLKGWDQVLDTLSIKLTLDLKLGHHIVSCLASGVLTNRDMLIYLLYKLFFRWRLTNRSEVEICTESEYLYYRYYLYLNPEPPPGKGNAPPPGNENAPPPGNENAPPPGKGIAQVHPEESARKDCLSFKQA
ncbi:unnamed protein product [Peronospora belbahrii]|nr:unnamed protein product [Peronospora belbahrii]